MPFGTFGKTGIIATQYMRRSTVTLYLIYVTSLANLNLYGELFSCADDMALLITGTNWEKVHQNAKTDMRLISIWFLKQSTIKL